MEETVGGGDAQFNSHIPNQNAQSDGIINDVRYSLFSGLQEYGWFVLLACVLVYFAYSKLSNNLNTPSSARSTSSRTSRGGGSSAEDAERILEQQEKIAVARARMQAQLDENVEKEKIRMREREEQARQKKIDEWENLQSGKGYYSKMKNASSNNIDSAEALEKITSEKSPKSKPIARRDYNPLMGDSSSGQSCSWRPAARRSGGGWG